MKKILTIVMTFLFTAGLFAIDMDEWSWDDYNVSFKVPTDFKVIKNDTTQFSASNKGIRLTISPVKGKAPSADQMISSLLKWVDGNKVTYDAANLDTIEDLNGYFCAYVPGTKDQKATFSGLMFNPADTNVRLYVQVTFDPGLTDPATEILMSFTPK